jgi:hypothetical protein
MCAVERIDVSTIRQRRPSTRLHGAAHLQREGVEPDLPFGGLETVLEREPPQRAVGADVIEAVIVDADMGEMRGHPSEGPLASKVEELAVVGGVELQQRGPVLEAFRPLGPAAGGVAAVDREHGRAAAGGPGALDRGDLGCGQLEEPVDLAEELLWVAVAVDADHGVRQ